MSERQIEMTWRCTMCGHRNLGRHAVCQGCGDAKDASEKYEMPGDTAAAPTVTDPKLLAIARGGANWRCRYCGSDQRRADGTCRQCGASSAEAVPRATRLTGAPVEIPGLRAGRRVVALGVTGVVAAVLSLCGALSLRSKTQVSAAMERAGAARLALPFEDVPGTVQAVKWQHRVDVERYQKVEKEGFEENRPATALDVKSAGDRFHHSETVQVGTRTEHYTVTEPDGYDTETYTEQESCGQDCTPTPQTCQEVCTPNENGFATCRTSCSGGGQSCTTRYCSVTKTRQVPRTKQVQKSREVPEYAQRAVNQTWYTWREWEWAHQRTHQKQGTGTATEWPSDEEVALGKKLSAGEAERARRVRTYSVVVDTARGPREAPLPDEAALSAHAPGKVLTLRLWQSGRMDLL